MRVDKAKSDAKAKAQPSPTRTPDANLEMAARTGKVLGFLLFFPLYFLPWIVAASRRHRNRTRNRGRQLLSGMDDRTGRRVPEFVPSTDV